MKSQEEIRKDRSVIRFAKILETIALKLQDLEEETRKANTRELLQRFEVEFQKLTAEFEVRSQQWEVDRQSLRQQITRLGEELTATQTSKVSKEGLEEALQWFQNKSNEFEAEREQFSRRIADLEEELAKAREQHTLEKTKLAEEFQQASTRWKQERESFQTQRPAPGGGGPRDVSDAVRAEVSRVEALLSEIARKMEDPSLELMAEIRFNQERAQLETYLKGLRYPPAE